MKKIIIIFCMLTLFTGCNKTDDHIENYNEPKNYEKMELDCNLKNISFINGQFIISDNILYQYSEDKIFESTNNHCKVVNENVSEYKYLGMIYWPDSMNPFKFIKDGIVYTLIENEGFVDKNVTKECQEQINDYNNNSLYYYSNGNFITNSKIHRWLPNEKQYDISIDEEVLFYTSELNYIITKDNVYEIGITNDDKCNTYADVDCTYELIKTEKLDNLLKDFKDNFYYFDGNYLVTNDNIIYRIFGIY